MSRGRVGRSMDRRGSGMNQRQMWEEASPGGSTSRSKAGSAPYDCRELVEFLRANPERDGALIRAYIASQARGVRDGRW